MAETNPTDRQPFSLESPAAEDAATERAVLRFILDEHPDQPTAAELSLALCPEAGGFASEDSYERAIRELLAAGLLRRQGEALLPTRPALRFHRLEER